MSDGQSVLGREQTNLGEIGTVAANMWSDPRVPSVVVLAQFWELAGPLICSLDI
jgi:hypothetical protein